MNINIYDSGSLLMGSTRIYRNNLARYLREVGHTVEVNPDSGDDCDVMIFGKETSVSKIIELGSGRDGRYVVGKIHPTDTGRDGRKIFDCCDFFIAGSIEEVDYYRRYSPNVFQFPQIESIDLEPKEHAKAKEIIFGYHGNKMHLENAGAPFWRALERVGRERRVKLLVVYDVEQLGILNCPVSVKIDYRQWEYKTAWTELKTCDVGLVPGVVAIARYLDLLEKKLRLRHGFSNDYIVRFKNTTNAGRAFVFHQLGVPVIAGFSPSHFHILGNPECGRMAHCEEGWYRAMCELSDSHTLRQAIANKARESFNREYNPLIWAERLGGQIAALT